MANTLAYNSKELFSAEESFICEASEGLGCFCTEVSYSVLSL
jgi:hypothetical protein